MSRLKIVDQNQLQVPFRYDRMGIALAYNGEVYNHRDIWSYVTEHPETSCDAEAIAALYRSEGQPALQKLNGMFGLVLVDQKRNEILIARDRAGKKPVYWTRRGRMLYVASEAKALPVRLSHTRCEDMELIEFDFRDSLPLTGIHVLEPGKYILLHGPEDMESPTPRTWWSLPDPSEVEPISRNAAIDRTHELLIDAISIRAKAEVPVAIPLSGGLDSAVIQAVVKSERLYCVTFTESDNLAASGAAARGQVVIGVTFTPQMAMTEIGRIAYHLDTPATWSALCLWFLAKKMRTDGVKVLLSGEGADELFGGYSRYRILHWLDRMAADPHLEAYAPTISHVLGAEDAIIHKMLDRSWSGMTRVKSDGIRQPGGSLVDRMSRTDFLSTMQVLLRMSDRMTMAHGIEGRMPYLDHRLVEFAFRLPPELKVTDTESKPLLRAVARRLGVLPVITEERTKRGLAIPWRQWCHSMVYSPAEGTRGVWDRSSFYRLMLEVWGKACCRNACCTGCED